MAVLFLKEERFAHAGERARDSSQRSPFVGLARPDLFERGGRIGPEPNDLCVVALGRLGVAQSTLAASEESARQESLVERRLAIEAWQSSPQSHDDFLVTARKGIVLGEPHIVVDALLRRDVGRFRGRDARAVSR